MRNPSNLRDLKLREILDKHQHTSWAGRSNQAGFAILVYQGFWSVKIKQTFHVTVPQNSYTKPLRSSEQRSIWGPFPTPLLLQQ